MSSVQPVEMHIAVFCIVIEIVMFVVDAIGGHIMEACSAIGLIMPFFSPRVCPTWSKTVLGVLV